ncbi:zinc metalloprotease [Nocardioides marmoraquaticus]
MTRSRLGLAVATAAALVLPVLPSAASASTLTGGLDRAATTISAAAVRAMCAPPAGSSARTGPGARDLDHPGVSARDLAALDVPSDGVAARSAARALPDAVVVPVHVVLVRGTHRGDAGSQPSEVPGWIDILNQAYAGAQSAESAPTRYSFYAASVRQVRNDRWYHAVPDGRADREMRRTLHRGSSASLNLYVTRPGSAGDDILGFARFPWQYKATPRRDGVTVNREALPGGRVRGYNRGDTLVHEVGHWMGLFHTFQGGCSASTGGDKVADTPAEARASFYCEVGRDTCRARGDDPVHNFMNYSLDSCMDQLTPGQVARMDLAYERYRVRR